MTEQYSRGSKTDLSDALTECKESARLGRDIAADGVSMLKRSIDHMSAQLDAQIRTLEKSKFHDSKMADRLILQLSDIRSDFGAVPMRVEDDVRRLLKDTFSITLFGRTMAGKSTLMEILTHGKGTSIGKGGQRTTRDVRTYRYKDLQITDVPGIAAFEGADDERVAYEAAQKGDLILFLITSDAPQAEEAKCLDRVIHLGKPVICLINVKVDLSGPDDLEKGLFRCDMKKRFETGRLRAIQEQFVSFGRQYGSDWRSIPFIPVHLKAAFLSQQDDFRLVRDEVYEFSKFREVEEHIIREVCTRGSFYKFKTFLDAVSVPLRTMSEMLFRQSVENIQQKRVLREKREKLASWISTFEEEGEQQIETFLTGLQTSLRQRVAAFAEEHYDDGRAANAWTALLEKHNIDNEAEELMNCLGRRCEAEICEISRELCAESQFFQHTFSDDAINMEGIIDGKRIWRWGCIALNGGIAIAALLNMWNPGGWVLFGIAAVSILGDFFFTDRERKVREARCKLEKKLKGSIDGIIERLRKEMMHCLHKNLIDGYMRPLQQGIHEIETSVTRLFIAQRQVACALNRRLREINAELLKKVLAHGGCDSEVWPVEKVARIPGDTIIVEGSLGRMVPEETLKGLEALLREKIICIEQCDDVFDVLRRVVWWPEAPPAEVWRSRSYIMVQDVPCCIRFLGLEIRDAAVGKRTRLAQQLTEMVVMG